jgi:hypothetical protein
LAHLRFVVIAASVLWPWFTATQARAHFALVAPDSWAAQDALGLPEKSAPCGQADPGIPVMPTGLVTTADAGSLLTITIDEKIFHPGHYRVSLAPDQASLPADPPVTAGATPCGSTTIADNPTLPLLADGLLVHDAAFNGPQTIQVQLPDGVTCTNCTLQVTEFMSDHPLNNPGGCFYHHCATLTIVAPPPDAGPSDAGGDDAGALDVSDAGDAGLPAAGGCGSTASQVGGPFAALLVPVIAVLGVLRRRPRSSATSREGHL